MIRNITFQIFSIVLLAVLSSCGSVSDSSQTMSSKAPTNLIKNLSTPSVPSVVLKACVENSECQNNDCDMGFCPVDR